MLGFFGFSILNIACFQTALDTGKDGDEQIDDTSDGVSLEPSEEPEPETGFTSGHWSYTIGAETLNTCPEIDDSVEQPTDTLGFQLQEGDIEGSLIITPDDSTESFTCQLQVPDQEEGTESEDDTREATTSTSAESYLCSSLSTVTSFPYSIEELNMEVNISIQTLTNLTIERVSSEEAIFNYSLDFICQNIDLFGCDVATDLPCNVEFYSNAVLDQ